MSDSDEVEDFSEIENSANAARASLLPEKSKARDMSEHYRASNLRFPTSLWSEYSMLKLTLCANENLDISKCKQVISFLKRKNDGYIPKKANIFTKEEVTRFLCDAPDHAFLLMKVAMVLGVAGACRTDELYNLNYEDVEIKPGVGIVKILQSKNKIPRLFVVTDVKQVLNIPSINIQECSNCTIT